MDFGVTEITSRHCVAQGCKKTATAVIGNTKYKYNLKNLFVCDEHLEVIHKALQNQFYGDEMFTEQPNDTITNDGNIKHQEIIKKYISLLYDNNNMISKAKLTEFCNENGIELPEEELSIKKYMELIFPGLGE